ncbi:MAG TPA: glycosyltransferase [Ignavibacteriaceae bacterium]|nr:glycosyltransferase [Ignavibacteriaceae bacterium]
MNNQKEKYLFLYLRTGGGHLAPARSISNYINKNYADSIDTILLDGFEKTNKLVKFIIEDGYRLSQTKAPWIYEFFYAFYKIPFISRLNNFFLSFFIRGNLKTVIKNESPDKILIFHFFLIKPLYDVVKKENLKVNIFTIVTDPFTAHPIWFLKKDQNFIVFSEKLRKKCIRYNISAERLNVFPFIIDEKFTESNTTDSVKEIKKQFGFNINKKLILLLGGGEGIPRGLAIVSSLIHKKTTAEIVVVCGRNDELYDELCNFVKKSDVKNIKLFKYVNFVEKLIKVSDVVITKCGASTFMEILASKKMPVVINYIWEQEKGNVEFLTQNKLGVYEKNIEKLPGIIKKIISGDKEFAAIHENIKNSDFKNGLDEIVKFIMN